MSDIKLPKTTPLWTVPNVQVGWKITPAFQRQSSPILPGKTKRHIEGCDTYPPSHQYKSLSDAGLNNWINCVQILNQVNVLRLLKIDLPATVALSQVV